jgi:hypothetical protein
MWDRRSAEQKAMDELVAKRKEDRRNAVLAMYRDAVLSGRELTPQEQESVSDELGKSVDIGKDRGAARRHTELLDILTQPDPDFAAMQKEIADAGKAELDIRCLIATDYIRAYSSREDWILIRNEGVTKPYYERVKQGFSTVDLPDRGLDAAIAVTNGAKKALKDAEDIKPDAKKELDGLHRNFLHLFGNE